MLHRFDVGVQVLRAMILLGRSLGPCPRTCLYYCVKRPFLRINTEVPGALGILIGLECGRNLQTNTLNNESGEESNELEGF